jgi:hypothetical protein
MFKTVRNRVWAFDAEWIPDPLAGKLLYNLPDEQLRQFHRLDHLLIFHRTALRRVLAFYNGQTQAEGYF